jgi:hypothetical protein
LYHFYIATNIKHNSEWRSTQITEKHVIFTYFETRNQNNMKKNLFLQKKLFITRSVKKEFGTAL